MKKSEILSIIAATITVFAFVTGIQSLDLINGNNSEIKTVTIKGNSSNFQKVKRVNTEPFIFTVSKSLVIIPVVALAAILSVPLLLSDVVLAFFGKKFVILSYIWGHIIVDNLFNSWIWMNAGELGKTLSILMWLGLAILALYLTFLQLSNRI